MAHAFKYQHFTFITYPLNLSLFPSLPSMLGVFLPISDSTLTRRFNKDQTLSYSFSHSLFSFPSVLLTFSSIFTHLTISFFSLSLDLSLSSSFYQRLLV
ncbi:hypothetical protein BDF14DRAFT_234439 [Spinellus fusiger]|nr:hypothetical protein BDF14DRAFT_234439 [Spinellus fusiger]